MTAARPSSQPATPHGASPVGGGNGGDRRKRGLLLGALLLAVLLLAALLLSQCGADDDTAGSASTPSSSRSEDASTSASASPTATASAPTPPAAAPGGAAGQIVAADGADVLGLTGRPDAAAALGALVGQQVTATGAQVLSVPADEGFWVGTSEQQRVWVQLTGEAGESPYQVAEGDTVDFEGAVVRHDGAFAGTVGVDEAAGAAQLTEQGAHLEVAKSAVRLSS